MFGHSKGMFSLKKKKNGARVFKLELKDIYKVNN